MNKILLVLSVLFATPSFAGQVLMSCDFSGYEGLSEVQVKKMDSGSIITFIFLRGQDAPSYSLPFSGEIGREIDLSHFNYFNDFSNPKIVHQFDPSQDFGHLALNHWKFISDEASQSISCTVVR